MPEQSDHDLLITLNIKMDVLSQQLVTHTALAEKTHANHDGRLTALEQWKWRWAGAIGIAVFLINILAYAAVRMVLR